MVLRDTSGSRIAFAYGAVTLSGGPFQAASTSEPICNSLPDSQIQLVGPTTPRLQRLRPITQPRFGLLRFRSPLLTECSLLLEVLRCFSSLGVLVTAYVFNRASRDITPGGFPHSDISGSTLARNSPKHFAACHVLRRLLAPRHPPHALSSLTYSVHAASTVLACATTAVASESPRRNRCFHSSTVKVVRPLSRTLAALLATWVHRSTRGRSDRRPVTRFATASAFDPLTDERHSFRGAQRSEDRFSVIGCGACHNDREEDLVGLPARAG